MTTNVPTLCVACARAVDLTGASHPDGETALCTSFPEGIPDAIYLHGADHRASLEGEPPFQLRPDAASRRLHAEWLAWMGEADWPEGPPAQAVAAEDQAPGSETT
jgi:hypothetical protein